MQVASTIRQHPVLGELWFDDGELPRDDRRPPGPRHWVARPFEWSVEGGELYIAGTMSAPDARSLAMALDVLAGAPAMLELVKRLEPDVSDINWVDCCEAVPEYVFLSSSDPYVVWCGVPSQSGEIRSLSREGW